MALDDDVNDTIIQEQNPQGEAVKALISIKKRESAEVDTDVEVKTDLSEDEIKIHTIADTISSVLEMNEKEFTEKCILSSIVNKKERKAISKLRQSRKEIVEIARQPDMNVNQEQAQTVGFLKRMFTPKQRV